MLTFELIESNSENKIYRAAIIGGWLVRCDSQLAFVPDFNHEWDGSSVIPDDTQFTATSRQYERRYGKPDTGHSLFTDSIPDEDIGNDWEKLLKIKIETSKPITEINVGDRFLCIKDVVMNEGMEGECIGYYKDKEYKSAGKHRITDDEGCVDHWWNNTGYNRNNESDKVLSPIVNEYFIKL